MEEMQEWKGMCKNIVSENCGFSRKKDPSRLHNGRGECTYFLTEGACLF
jgi:hypothetical protein